VELIGEHRSPYETRPARYVRGSTKNQRCPSRRGLRRFRFSGKIVLLEIDHSPVRRDTGPPQRRVFVFLGFVLRIGANRLT
jgi:hypothetical protein